MRGLEKLTVLVIVIALCGIVASHSAAATFTYSAPGSLSGRALNTQVFKTGGSVECTTGALTGTINSTAFSEQEVTVSYSGCKAFGFIGVDITPATYLFTAGGSVHLENAITINATGAGCHQTVEPQTLSGITYTNLAAGRLGIDANVSGIKWSGTGGLCGTSGTAGTYTGNGEVERVGGGTIAWDK